MTGLDVEDFMALGLAPRTAYIYARTATKLAAQLAARESDLLTCTGADVAAVIQLWRNSYATRNQVRAAFLASWALLDRDSMPLRAIRVPPKPKGRCRALDEDPASVLEQAAWDRGDLPGLAVLLGLYAGLRRAEIAGLRWEDVTVDITGAPTWLRVHGKGDLVADVPVHAVLARALGPRYRGKGWIFPGRWRTDHVASATIWDWSRRVAIDAGLTAIAPHVLRHTALAEMNDRSGDLRTVQDIARHARPETTAGYTRTTSRRMTAVVAMVDYGRRLDELAGEVAVKSRDELGEDYGAAAARVYGAILAVLFANLHARTLNPVELWDQWAPGWPSREPGVTWMQWSVAHEAARETMGLPPNPWPTGDVAYVFAMDDPDALARFKELSRAR